MAESVPPGRAGRQWLAGRISYAERSMELLDRKLVLLHQELRGLAERHETAGRTWAQACKEAERWGLRVAALDGAGLLRASGATIAGRTRVEVPWRNTLGVLHPGEPRVTPGELAPAVAAGGASLAQAASAYRRAIDAAAAFAAAERSLAVLHDELRATRRRRRAIERRRLPALNDLLTQLNLRLDEIERDELAMVRWAAERRAGADGER